MKNLSKEQIKDRLIKKAAEFWGADEMELEHSFDPLVSLIFDACSSELEKISNEIKSSRTRMTERLVDILTPEVSVTAKPSHAIMHALPVEEKLTIKDATQFFHRKRLQNVEAKQQDNFKDYFFSPTDAFKITNCTLKYLVLPTGINILDDLRFKEVISPDKFTNPLAPSSLWIAIKPETEDMVIDNLMFYFNINNSYHKELFLHHLKISQWTINGKPVKTKKGYNADYTAKSHYDHYLNKGIQSKINLYENHINAFYEKYFITLNEEIEVKGSLQKYPDEFAQLLNSNHLQQFEEDLMWIKITFSSVISTRILSDVYCYINCFPVINKKLNEKQQRLQKYLNIVPLEIKEDFFLDVYDIVNDNGYHYFNNSELSDEDRNRAYVRYGGVSRFDERDASELLHYVLDILKEDSVAFSSMGDDFINTNVGGLKQIMARIEQKINQSNFIKNKVPYIIIENHKKNDKFIFAEYWTTTGAEANKMHPFVRLEAHKGTDFNAHSLYFVTGTLGGENEPSASNKIYAYRESILSKGRVVTEQDIIHLCHNHFKDNIKSVEVRKGVQVMHDPGIGYTPTIDIYVYQHKKNNYSNEDWEFQKENLLILLSSRSSNLVPFRVFYKN